MGFAVFVPPQATKEPVPVLFYLAGLTCTEETATIKAGRPAARSPPGAWRSSCPDTSPRGAGIAGEDDDWDFGTGAGFYVDASAAPWAGSYPMESYVVDELRRLVTGSFPVRPDAIGIFGHSMGGHGALTLGAQTSRASSDRCRPLRPSARPVPVPGVSRPSRAISATIDRAGGRTTPPSWCGRDGDRARS